jgi:hypothetical protein
MPAISLSQYLAQEQQPMRRGLVQNMLGNSVFMRILRFVPVEGISYTYGQQSTLPGVAFRGFNEEYMSSAGVVNPKTERLVPFGGTIQVDHTLEGSDTHTNALLAKTRAAGLFYDFNVINGDPTENPKAFYGLKARLTGNQVITQADNGGDVTWEKVADLLDLVAGPNNKKVLVMSKYQRRKLKNDLLADVSGATLGERNDPLTSFEGARIEVLDEDDVETPVLPQTETQGSSAVTGSIYCIVPGEDPAGDMVQGLIKSFPGQAGDELIVHKKLAQVNTLVGDLVEMLGGLGVFHGRAAARLKGLT